MCRTAENCSDILKFECDRYIAFENDKERRDCVNQKKLFQTVKNRSKISNPFLLAKYSCTGNADNGADLDNVLLYNTGLCTRFLQGLILERERFKASNKPRIDYEYKCISRDEFDSLKDKMIGKSEYKIDTLYIDATNEPPNEGEKVVFYYNLFREWLSRIEEEKLNNMKSDFQDKELEMLINYGGRSSLSESRFVKRIIDGVIAALEPFRTDARSRQIRGIECQCSDASVLVEDGLTINGNGWNPQDHLLRQIILLKEEDNKLRNKVRIRIRPV